MKFKRNLIIFTLLFFISLLLNFINLKLYEVTIISIEIILAIYLTGVLFFFIFKNILNKLSPWDDFNNFIFSFFVAGSFLTTLVLGLNYGFAEKQTGWKTFEIVRKTEIGRRKYGHAPAVIINTYNNETKRIVFKRNLKKEVDSSGSLELKLSKGFLNFYVIKNTKLR